MFFLLIFLRVLIMFISKGLLFYLRGMMSPSQP